MDALARGDMDRWTLPGEPFQLLSPHPCRIHEQPRANRKLLAGQLVLYDCSCQPAVLSLEADHRAVVDHARTVCYCRRQNIEDEPSVIRPCVVVTKGRRQPITAQHRDHFADLIGRQQPMSSDIVPACQQIISQQPGPNEQCLEQRMRWDPAQTERMPKKPIEWQDEQ
ncbi:hypothetical protein HRbin27_01663 [bacterium HR27]|nr:hypothetical protein HRbin27_01663 [bacterium HR27]